MKSQLLRKPAPVKEKPLQLTDLPRPDVTEGHLVVKVSACGVCHTDWGFAKIDEG